MYAGVDEAGRGPVLGPLVVAGVHGDPGALPDGVTDSKQLSPERRRELAGRIEAQQAVRVHRVRFDAPTLNERMGAGESLDAIETEGFATVLAALGTPQAIVDPVGSDAGGFAERLARALDGCEVQARPKADKHDPMVGAASILAKVERDRAIDELARSVGEEIGSGYPSDPRTRRFLTRWREENRDPPPFARREWATLRSIGFGVHRLDEFDAEGGTT